MTSCIASRFQYRFPSAVMLVVATTLHQRSKYMLVMHVKSTLCLIHHTLLVLSYFFHSFFLFFGTDEITPNDTIVVGANSASSDGVIFSYASLN